MPSLWRLASTRWLFATSVLGFGGLFVTLSALPAEAVRHGAGAGIGGLVITVLFATTVFTQIFVGRIVARIGLTPTLVIGLLAMGAPSPLYLVDYGLPWWLVVSMVRGAGFGIVAVLGALLAARIVEPQQLGRSIGLYGLSIALANMITTPLGVALANSGHFTWVAIIAAVPVLAVGCAAPVVRRAAAPAGDGVARTPTRQVVRQVAGPSVVLFGVTFTGGGLASYLPIDRPSGAGAAVALFVFATTGAGCRFGAGLLADRFGARRVVPVGILVAVAGILSLAATVNRSGDVGLALAAGLFGIGFGTVQNLTLVMSFGRAGAAGAATASAFWNGAFDFGTSIGAFAIGAAAASSIGFGATLVGCAVLIALTVLFIRSPTDGASSRARASSPAPPLS